MTPSVKIELLPGLIQFLLDHLDLSRQFNCFPGRALALFEEPTIPLDSIVTDCFQKFTLTALHNFLGYLETRSTGTQAEF